MTRPARSAILFGAAIQFGAMVVGATAVSCGGSVSETPWPAEPLDLEPGPAGEERARGNVIDTKKLPDNYTKQQEERAKEKTKAADPSSPTDDPEPVDEDEPLDEDESTEDDTDTSGEDE